MHLNSGENRTEVNGHIFTSKTVKELSLSNNYFIGIESLKNIFHEQTVSNPLCTYQQLKLSTVSIIKIFLQKNFQSSHFLLQNKKQTSSLTIV